MQRRMGTTTVYVTHDQTEAMTLGDRVAVLRKGLLQQVRVNARAALGVQILDAQHDAAALAFGTEPGQQTAGQIAQMQPPAGAGRKAPDHSPAHRPSFHCPSSGWKMGVL